MNVFFFQAEDGIRDLVRSRGLGDVYKRQLKDDKYLCCSNFKRPRKSDIFLKKRLNEPDQNHICLLYTSDAADERSSVDLGGRRIIKKKTQEDYIGEYMRKTKKDISSISLRMDSK